MGRNWKETGGGRFGGKEMGKRQEKEEMVRKK
jgi:hypothetical protein